MSGNHTYSIDFQSLSNGKHDFRFDIGARFFESWPESEVQHGTGTVTVELTKHPSMMELDVIIDAVVEVTCDRCLDTFRMPIHFEGHPVVKISDVQGESDGDILWVSPSEDRLELSQYIYESIILSLPFQRVHPHLKDCNQEMLGRFKIVTGDEFDALEQQIESHAEAEGDEIEAIRNPFAALADLKKDMEK